VLIVHYTTYSHRVSTYFARFCGRASLRCPKFAAESPQKRRFGSSACPGTPVARGYLPMKVAIPNWRGRVSPVFDVAKQVTVVEVSGGVQRSRHDVILDATDPQARVARLRQSGADVLVCGAISWPLEMAVSAAGIDVIPHTCGDVESVLAAFIDGRLRQDGFLMPGCCGRRRSRGRHRRGRA